MATRVRLYTCTKPGCGELVPGGGRCPDHKRQAERARGSSAQRGYGHRHRDHFRKGVLAKHPVCVVCRRAPSTVADHHPLSRRELEVKGLDPNDPIYGRGLCGPCHSKETAANPDQQGGWNAR